MERNLALVDNTCPQCKFQLDAAAEPDDITSTQPDPGDFSVCANCGAFATFTENMSLQHFDDRNLELLSAEYQKMLIQTRRIVLGEQRGPLRDVSKRINHEN